MNRRSSATARRRLLVAAVLIAGCSGGLTRDPLARGRKDAAGGGGAVSAGAAGSMGGTTSSEAGKGGAGSSGVAGDGPVISSGGSSRGGGGGNVGPGGSGSRGGSGAGGSGTGGNAGESGGGGTSGTAAQTGGTGESGSAGDAGSGNSAGTGGLGIGLQAGLVYWFSADVGVTETGGLVSKWLDQSGNGAHAEQTTSALRPKLGTFASTDLPAMVFDGNDDYLDLPQDDSDFEAGLSFFCVARALEAPAGMAMLELSNGQDIDDLTFFRYYEAFSYEVGGTGGGFKFGGAFVVAEPRLVDVVHYENEFLWMFMNGASVADADFALPVRKVRGQNTIGRTLYTDSSPWSGEIAEILLYARALDANERQAVQSYLAEKWNCCDG